MQKHHFLPQNKQQMKVAKLWAEKPRQLKPPLPTYLSTYLEKDAWGYTINGFFYNIQKKYF